MEHMNRIVGFEFRPTDEELINHYLQKKTGGQTWLVDNGINEVKVYSFDPWELRFQSRIKSDDYLWHFFCRVEETRNQTRKTRSGFWKKTGVDIEIKPRRGNRRDNVIGLKKVLVFHRGNSRNAERTDWVMHEYHTNSFPPHQRNYVICKVEYKGEEELETFSANAIEPTHSFNNNFGASSSGSEVIQPVHGNSASFHRHEGLAMEELRSPNQFNGNLNPQQQSPFYDLDVMQEDLDRLGGGAWEFLFGHQEMAPYYMQEDRNAYRPPKPLTGRYDVDESSDSDSDDESSVSDSSDKEASSSVIDAATASNGHGRGLKNTEIVMTPSAAVKNNEREWKMSEDTIMKTSAAAAAAAKKMEKKGWFVYEDVMSKSRKNQLINIAVAFMVFVFLIHQIISVH